LILWYPLSFEVKKYAHEEPYACKSLMHVRAFLLLPRLFFTQGCHVSQVAVSGTGSVSSNGTWSAGGTVSAVFVPHSVASNIAQSDLSQFPAAGFVVSASVPSSAFSSDSSSQAVTTLTATTDTGYTSSIQVVLQSTAAAINPINAGDAVYSYVLPDTPQLEAWSATVAANTNSSASITSDGNLPFTGTGGTYTIGLQITSTVTDPSQVATVPYSEAPPDDNPCPLSHPHCSELPPGN
jgi:hypothetical protein